MKKFEVIREIFETILRVGFNDDKQDAISEYTRDKIENPVYVKKVAFNDAGQIDSIAVTAMESDFSDACDSDIRIAFKSNIGKRVILYANEVEFSVLLEIRNYLRKYFGVNEDAYAFLNVMNAWDLLESEGKTVNLPNKDLRHILNKYYDIFVEPLNDK
jgi:hypothetical protein